MARGHATMKAIEEAIARLEKERAAFNMKIDGRIEGLREALGLQSGQPSKASTTLRRARRGDLKETVLKLAEEAGATGLTPEECVSQARDRKGIELVPASVSSLLSRLKTDDVLFFDGRRYRLKQFAGPRYAA